ncbi:metalloregulator ArsR/SmtB family transcription factor [Boseaceae bacterium BT-24-1]|nr:metalloregulator ArsR/SmtB family transcription factor [Boseaceae bacterium BT-24-1]
MDNYQASLDSIFHALADPTRRAVIQRLGQGEASVSDLAMRFDMALPSFMKHIGVLEVAGLIGSKKVGRVRTCKLEPTKLAVVEKWYDDQRAIWDARYKNLDNLLNNLKGK